MKFSLYIATRYLLAKKSRNAINVISAVSVAGVTVGTMALIIVLSVFNGLEDMINRIFTIFDPDIRITAATGKVFVPDSSKLLRLAQVPGIVSFSQILEENSLLRYGERQYIATIRGVDNNYSKVTEVDSTIIEGEFRLKSPGGRPETVLGAGVAEYLGLNINFVTPLQIYVPRRTGSVNINPENAFIEKYISPSGIYQIEHEFDSRYYFVPIDFARELLEYETEISSIDIRINEMTRVETVQNLVMEIFGNNFNVQNRFQQKEIFYKVMRSERLAIFIILTLILVIASFNIIGSLTMLIIEKERDIAILRSLGADNTLIRRIFLMEGWLISIIGAAAGIVFGFIICWLQQRYGVIKLPSETLIISTYPVVLKLKDFIIVPSTVLLIGFLAAWYPVRYLSRKYLKEETGLRIRPSQAGSAVTVSILF
ncbi:MAG: FtsX-like permease family protein, partial [Bacteroidales bacterium]